MIGFLGHACFLECHCLLSAFEALFELKHAASRGCHVPTYPVVDNLLNSPSQLVYGISVLTGR